ncbi:MAG TPA: radical SAM protein [Ktedonobacteraceae bacterium]|nr:radical SAM protein [Ktedonobacteraceae bacterium]
MNSHDVRYLLINLPLTDPTVPYHSISYLVGSTSSAGYTNFSCLDANIEALNYLARKEHLASLLSYCEEIRTQLEKKGRLTRWEQILYRYALGGVGLTPETASRAIEIMKAPERFYEYGTYRQAVMAIIRWLNLLSVQGFPGQFNGFSLLPSSIGNLASIDDLTNPSYLNRLINPFSTYFNGPFTELLLSSPWNLVGLSVNYASQLPFAIFMSRLIRKHCPHSIICMGGTEISDDIKFMHDPTRIWELFPDCDALVVGEGETALIEILDAIAREEPLPEQRPGILLPGAPEALRQPQVRYENLSTLADPRYDIWDWSQYWIPEPVVLYSPTRGCYWNKCTFCDYGLNTTSPTSPSRVRPLERAIQEIQNLTRFARTVYFSVDAIAPSYLRKLSRAIQENNISIRWGAELRLERTFMKDLAYELKKAGCVAISFGYESGSQRVLNLINKGINLQQVPGVLQELSNAGIGVQMMGFIGFPGETPEEAYDTFEFLRQHRDYWTLAGIGNFVLTRGSIVAKRFQDFGIQQIHAYSGDDIARELYWIDNNGQTRLFGDMRNPDIDDIAKVAKPFVDDRPFVGGIDSSHSMLYFSKYGPSLVPPHVYAQQPSQVLVETARYQTPLRQIDSFLDKEDIHAYYDQYRSQGRPLGFAQLMDWLMEYPQEQIANEEAGETEYELLEIYPGGHYITCSPQMIDVENSASGAYQTVKALLLRTAGAL